MNTENHTVKRGSKEIILSPIEFRLLEFFLQNRNHVLSRLTIEEAVWDTDDGQESNVVDVYVNHLRNKIDRPFKHPLIKTVRGFGYKLDAGDNYEI
jgi:DNA-binding response OmpR family regulator